MAGAAQWSSTLTYLQHVALVRVLAATWIPDAAARDIMVAVDDVDAVTLQTNLSVI